MLQPFGPNIWTAYHPQKLLGATLGTRMTVVKIDDAVWLHSAIPIDDALADEIAAIGPVRWIVAPNLWHHLHVEAARARYPDAALFIASGLEQKNRRLHDGEALTSVAPPAWNDALRPIPIAGIPKMNEHVFVHAESKTLISSDLFFNIAKPDGWWSKTLMWMMRMSGPPRHSMFFKSCVKDPAATAASFAELTRQPIDKIIIAHGDLVTSGGIDTLRAVSAWLAPHQRSTKAAA